MQAGMLCAAFAYEIWKNEGEFLNLTCSVMSTKFVEWRKSGSDTLPIGRVYFQHNLLLNKAAASDSGIYSCNDRDSGYNIIRYNVRVKGKTCDDLFVVD